MEYEIAVADVPARRTAVVAATTTWEEFPALWRELSGEVWECLRASGIDWGAVHPPRRTRVRPSP